jgi:DNA-binding NtrC family response regulator
MKIAVVSTDPSFVRELAAKVRACGHEPEAFSDLRDAVHGAPTMALTVWDDGAAMAEMLDGLRRAASQRPPVPVVVFVPAGALAARSRARAAGAIDVLCWPPEPDEITAEITDVFQRAPLLDGIDREAFDRFVQDQIIGQSPPVQQCIREMLMAARCDANVLLLGETGTGKEVFARGIHLLGRRAGNPYLVVNCPALPGSLLESELFGCAKGAFTGADSDRRGRFEEVGAGTLLLDEIGFVSPDFQAKLLRVIEQKVFQRLGENRDIPSHARLICATSVDLETAAKQGGFRPDLLGRIDQLRITLPPLRERRDDIPLLLRHFLAKHARGHPVTISRSAMDVLKSAEFPMNVRQLENVLVGALVRSEAGELILPKHLPKEVTESRAAESAPSGMVIRFPAGLIYKEARDLVCRELDFLYLPKLLRKHEGNVGRAVEEAGIDRKTFNERLKAAAPSGESERHA